MVFFAQAGSLLSVCFLQFINKMILGSLVSSFIPATFILMYLRVSHLYIIYHVSLIQFYWYKFLLLLIHILLYYTSKFWKDIWYNDIIIVIPPKDQVSYVLFYWCPSVCLSVCQCVCPKLNVKTKHFPVTPKLSKNSPFAWAWCCTNTFCSQDVVKSLLHVGWLQKFEISPKFW